MARDYRWAVYGEYGEYFTNLKDAKAKAKECSTFPEYDYVAQVWYLKDGCWYFEYQNGKLVRDGWTIPKK